MASSTASRGTAYECIPCRGTSKPIINSYQYVVTHYRKVHLEAKECPAWCGLCDYRCDDMEGLKDHVDKFPKHKDVVSMQKKWGINIDPAEYFNINNDPVPIAADIGVYDREQSREIYAKRSLEKGRKNRPSSKTETSKPKDMAIPSPDALTSQILSVLPSKDEQTSMDHFDAETVVGSPKDKRVVEREATPATSSSSSEGDSSESDSESEKENKPIKQKLVKKVDRFANELNRNLEKASQYVTKCFNVGEEAIRKLTSKMEAQTQALDRMTSELRRINTTNTSRESRSNYHYDSRDSRYSYERNDRRYHPY